MKTKKKESRTLKSSASRPKEGSAISKETLALGQALVKELNLDPNRNTLTCWMAHYIAELIADARKATETEKFLAEKRCADAIQALWRERDNWPDGTRPFEALDPIRNALRSLDLSSQSSRYFNAGSPPAKKGRAGAEESWLSLVSGLDYSARVLIRYFLSQAGNGASARTRKWFEKASAAGLDEGIEFEIASLISTENALRAKQIESRAKQELKQRVERLEIFVALAAELAKGMRRKL